MYMLHWPWNTVFVDYYGVLNGGTIIHHQDTPSGLPKMIRKLGSYSSFNRVRDFRRALKPPVDWFWCQKILNHQTSFYLNVYGYR